MPPLRAILGPGLGVLRCAAGLFLSPPLPSFNCIPSRESIYSCPPQFPSAHPSALSVSAAVSEALSSSLLLELEGSHLDVLINIVFRSQVYDYNPSLPTLLTLALLPARLPE